MAPRRYTRPGSCARTTTGRAAAAPPSSAMNSRRFVPRSQRRRDVIPDPLARFGPGLSGAYTAQYPEPQILGHLDVGPEGFSFLCVASIAGHPPMAGGDRTAWLGWEDSNSEMSSQNMPLKGRTDFRSSR